MSGDMTASKNASAEDKGTRGFDCLNCHSHGLFGMDHCLDCGTRYVWQDIPEVDEGSSDDDLSSDSEPLFDQKAVECGYLDVEGGVFAFTGPTCSNRYELSECLNCGTLLEIPVKSCPLCGGALDQLTGGLTKLMSGAIAGSRITTDLSGRVFCQSCGDMAYNKGGNCSNCTARLSPQSVELSIPLSSIFPSENIVFAHLNIESGTMECLSQDGQSESIEAGEKRLLETTTAMDIDTFGMMRLMFDEQACVIIGLTSEAPMIASEICRRMGIPRSVCYRKLKMMTDAKLLSLCRAEGAPCEWQVSRYQSNIDMAYVSLEHGDMNMLIRLKDNKETMTQRFSSDLQ